MKSKQESKSWMVQDFLDLTPSLTPPRGTDPGATRGGVRFSIKMRQEMDGVLPAVEHGGTAAKNSRQQPGRLSRGSQKKED